GQGEAEKDKPKHETVSLHAILEAQVGSEPRKGQHDQSTTNHDPEREERDDDWWAVLCWEIGQTDFLGGKAHAPDQTAENGDLDFIVVGLRRRIRDCKQHLSGRLLIMPAALDCCEFRRLIFVDI